MSDFDNLREDIKGLGTKVDQLSLDVSVLISKSHTPLDCPLSDKVGKLQLGEARRGGVLAVVGVIGGLVASAVMIAVGRLVGR